jgi:argininosuccinate synthase
MERIVVPFTSVDAADAVSDLIRRHATEVVAVAVDIGQAVPLDELRRAALAAGAARCHVFDHRDRLAARFLWPALRAGTIGVSGEPVVTALSAPCVAETVVEVARLEGAAAVAATAPGARERQRLLAALRDLAPGLGVVTAAGARTPGDERNIWARVRGLDRTEAPALDDASTTSPARLVVSIAHGWPVALNGVVMPPDGIVESLATIARVQGVTAEVAADGDAPGQRWLVHAPAAVALDRACAAVAGRTLDEAARTFAGEAAAAYARLLRDGHWFTRLRGGLDAFAAHLFEAASGDVTMTIGERRIEVEA